MKKAREDANNSLGLKRKIFAVLLITLGVIGLFLPLIQGVLLILSGLAIYYNKSFKDIKEYVSKYIKRKN